MFNIVESFEYTIAEYFGSAYAVATDSCTHAIELCLRLKKYNNILIPNQTYISIPFTAEKLNLDWNWKSDLWEDFYYIGNTNIIDAAVLWKKNSYIKNTYMCLSFQYKKHLGIGRGGMILLDNESEKEILKRMSYDGRSMSSPWKTQNIDTIGYHYYMTPEIALDGLNKFKRIQNDTPKKWSYKDYPNLSKMAVFS